MISLLVSLAAGTDSRHSSESGDRIRWGCGWDHGMQIQRQIVLVTGAGRGLGKVIAEAFAAQGARLVVNYRHSRGHAEALTARFGPKHALNALPDYSFNGDARTKAAEIGWPAFAAQIGGSVGGALNTIQAAIPAMRAQRFGRMINIGSNRVQNPVVPYHDYTAAKAALLALTRTMAVDLSPDGITVNMVSRGLLRTTDASAATPAAVFDFIAANTPLRRVTKPAEFADGVLFFASPWSRAVTGQNLIVDGGLVKN